MKLRCFFASLAPQSIPQGPTETLSPTGLYPAYPAALTGEPGRSGNLPHQKGCSLQRIRSPAFYRPRQNASPRETALHSSFPGEHCHGLPAAAPEFRPWTHAVPEGIPPCTWQPRACRGQAGARDAIRGRTPGGIFPPVDCCFPFLPPCRRKTRRSGTH